MIVVLYNIVLLAAVVAGAPWWLWRMATTDKYRDGLRQRLGRVPQRLMQKTDMPVIWLHAVSVGEVIAVSRLVQEIAAAFPCRLLVSTTTRTGQQIARERFGPENVFYCPLDFPWAVRAYLDALRPRMLVLAETEFWPNLLHGCFRRQIPVVVVNARISDRSWPRYYMLRRLWSAILRQLTLVHAQSDEDAQRLVAIGCRPDRVMVSGNLKFDVRVPREAEATAQLEAQRAGLRFIVAGSTLEGEEAALLDAWPQLLAAEPNLVLVLAPRHPERFASVATLLANSGNAWSRRSDWKGKPSASLPPLRRGQVILLDTIGELASLYSLAAVAFVGGSLVPAGGHNPLEPCQFGVPAVMGPDYVNFRAITEDLGQHDAIRIASREQLADVLIALVRDIPAAQAMGRRARQVFEQHAGATERSLAGIREIFAMHRDAAAATASMEKPA